MNKKLTTIYVIERIVWSIFFFVPAKTFAQFCMLCNIFFFFFLSGVECKDPVITNAEWIDGSRPPHRYKAIVIYYCKPGYKMIGQSTLTCNISSQWSPRIPECISKSSSKKKVLPVIR